MPEAKTHRTGGELDEITDVRHYTGGEACQYKCGEPAEFVTQGKAGGQTITFAGCKSCLNRAAIYPIENGWVDERTDQVVNS